MRQGYQQGDVLFTKVKELPKGAARHQPPQKAGRHILVEGEHTGHAHTVAPRGVIISVTPEGRQFLEVLTGQAEIIHDDHKPQFLEKGVYEISQVVEIDPFSEAIERVRD